jgi:hypothetical protein
MEAILSFLSYAIVYLETKRSYDKLCYRGLEQVQALIPNKATQTMYSNQPGRHEAMHTSRHGQKKRKRILRW